MTGLLLILWRLGKALVLGCPQDGNPTYVAILSGNPLEWLYTPASSRTPCLFFSQPGFRFANLCAEFSQFKQGVLFTLAQDLQITLGITLAHSINQIQQ
jgi:hypothetical protein